jgi:hypothetical protein
LRSPTARPSNIPLAFDAMTETFRLKKSVKYGGMIATIFFAVVMGLATIVAFLVTPAQPTNWYAFAILVGICFAGYGTILLVSIYTWVSYYVERFTINGTTFSIRSVFQNRRFDVSDLQCLKWRVPARDGVILFHAAGYKARLHLSGYARENQLRIIRALRELVPAHMQDNWPRFCHKVALPLRDGEAPLLPGEPVPQYVTITRKRYDRIFMFVLPLSIAVAVAICARLDNWRSVVAPFPVVGAWLLMRFSVPPGGRAEARLSSTMTSRAELAGWGLMLGALLVMLCGVLVMLGGVLVLAGVAFLAVGRSILIAGCVLLLAAFPPLCYGTFQSNKRRRSADERAAELAPAHWQQGEGAAGNGAQVP